MVQCGMHGVMGMHMEHSMHDIRTTCNMAGPSWHTPAARRATDTFYRGNRAPSHPARACSLRT